MNQLHLGFPKWNSFIRRSKISNLISQSRFLVERTLLWLASQSRASRQTLSASEVSRYSLIDFFQSSFSKYFTSFFHNFLSGLLTLFRTRASRAEKILGNSQRNFQFDSKNSKRFSLGNSLRVLLAN